MLKKTTSNWKEYLNTILLSIVCYFIIDIHSSFKKVVDDVENLKIIVSRHEYILGLREKNSKKSARLSFQMNEAILPNNDNLKKRYLERSGKNKQV